MNQMTLVFSILLFSLASTAQTRSEYPIEVKVEANSSSFKIDGYSGEISSESIYYLWHNKPHNFFEKKNRSELETQIYLESEEGKMDLAFFTSLRNRLKLENCVLEVPINNLIPEYSVDKRQLCLMKAEQLYFMVPDKIQFEEIVLNKPATIDVVNRRVTNTVAWNYFCLPIPDLKIAQEIEQGNDTLILRIEFRIIDSNKVANSLFEYHLISEIKKMEIVEPNSQVIWKL